MISGREDICKWSLQHIIKAAEIYQDGSGFFLPHKGKNYLSIMNKIIKLSKECIIMIWIEINMEIEIPLNLKK